ncbi:hypothetical protein QFZ43_008909 [Streptomyces afghaniensis]|nr:hypothetical protein [Streptomyces afghaniensis]
MHGRNNPLPPVVMGLESGCCPEPPAPGRHLIYGRVFKGVHDQDGNHYSAGQVREVPWVAIPPVVTSIRVLERIAPDGLLFDSAVHAIPRGRVSTGRVIGFEAMRNRIEDFIVWVSGLAVRLDRPHEIVPDDPFGALGVARFRRSLAWHIARRPGGLVALAVQYGHLRTAVSAGYAARGPWRHPRAARHRDRPGHRRHPHHPPRRARRRNRDFRAGRPASDSHRSPGPHVRRVHPHVPAGTGQHTPSFSGIAT